MTPTEKADDLCKRLEAIAATSPGEQSLWDCTVAAWANERIKAQAAEIELWKNVARRAGVCMTCAIGVPEPYGCSDCLNTGWEGGSPAGFVPKERIKAKNAVLSEFYSALDEEESRTIAAERKLAEAIEKMRRLEKLRPHWAQGYSSDGIAAQVTTAALVGIHDLLGVDNQTAAVLKIRELLAEAEKLRSYLGRSQEEAGELLTRATKAEARLAEAEKIMSDMNIADMARWLQSAQPAFSMRVATFLNKEPSER